MAKIYREKDYIIRFDDMTYKLSQLARSCISKEQNTSLYKAYMAYDYRYRDGCMSANDIKFSTSERLNYKLHHGYSTKYIHKDHNNKLEDSKLEEARLRNLYKQENIDKNLDDYEVELSPCNYNSNDLLRLPVEIKL